MQKYKKSLNEGRFCTKISLIEGNICGKTSLIEGNLYEKCYIQLFIVKQKVCSLYKLIAR